MAKLMIAPASVRPYLLIADAIERHEPFDTDEAIVWLESIGSALQVHMASRMVAAIEGEDGISPLGASRRSALVRYALARVVIELRTLLVPVLASSRTVSPVGSEGSAPTCITIDRTPIPSPNGRTAGPG